MKFLLDENLSDRIPPQICDLFPGSLHVKECDLIHQADENVWRFARENGFAILTKDWDFHQMSLLRGFPPKVVFLKIGNCSTGDIVSVLVENWAEISAFLTDDAASLLILQK
jgi:predicted nuclease of predicted toxin-antitoxin system